MTGCDQKLQIKILLGLRIQYKIINNLIGPRLNILILEDTRGMEKGAVTKSVRGAGKDE